MFLTWLHRKLWQPSQSQRQSRPAIVGRFARPRLEPLEERMLLSTYLVTTTNDSGDGSLRQAIVNVNNGSGGDTIAFNIGGGGVQTIQPTSALPTITKSVTIDGTTQPGYAGTPLIVVNGNLFNDGPNGYGFDITASNVTVRGLDINGFTGSQIRLEGAGNDVIAGNYLGTDVTGTKAVSGSSSVANDGLFILSSDNTIGGPTAADRNLISGNFNGVIVGGTFTSGNLVEGNYIGTDASGANPLANVFGVQLAGPGIQSGKPGNSVIGNVISGNSDAGLFSIDSADSVIQGNLIGTDATGTKAVANGVFGMQIFDDFNDTIGGTAAGSGNLISGNKGIGLDIFGSPGSTGGIQIEGNYIGTDVTGTKALANATGIVVDSPNVSIGGTDIGASNLISGNTSFGVLIQSSGVNLEGNLIGTDVTGSQALGNSTGVSITAGGNTIGGTAAGAGNVISGNQQDGISISGTTATQNIVAGNTIGTDISGTIALGNLIGVHLLNGANANTIGGSDPEAGNLISGNRFFGIQIAGTSTADNSIQGNLIGTDVSGTTAVGNTLSGINDSGSNNTIGGITAAARNLISGNGSEGVFISGSGDVVEGNYIGTDITGTQAVANGYSGNGDGVIVFVGAANTTIGGSVAGAGNVISGNHRFGLDLDASNSIVQGNYIGTDAAGANAIANGNDGIFVNTANNLIGGTTAAARNVISGNGGNGIEIISTSATGNRVQGNYIGTDATGTQTIGNGRDGVGVFIGTGNTIGGTAPGAGNVISGNAGRGITIDANNTTVQGNDIGTDVSGTAAVGNGSDGVAILNGSDNTVGGTTSAAANIISANGGSGVLISGANATSNLIAGNFIGTDASGMIPLGNAADGVAIQNASNNTIGGTAAGAGNVIAFNGNDGVLVDTGRGNAILSDLIFANGNLGIELLNGGNNNQTAPQLLRAHHQDGSSTVVVGTLQSTPNTTFTLQFFSDPSPDPSGLGEGQQLLSTVTVTTDANGMADFEVTLPEVAGGQILTATATDANGNTSEFSLPVEVRGGPDDQ